MKITRCLPELSLAVGGLAAALLSGCASMPNIEADKAAATQIKRVAVLSIAEPANVQVANLGGAAGAFGLVGGLIQGTTNADHSKQFVAVDPTGSGRNGAKISYEWRNIVGHLREREAETGKRRRGLVRN